MRGLTLGAVADDLTGAADLAGTLVAAGVRTALRVGVPEEPAPPGTDAVVVALKARTVPAAEAVDAALAALAWLRAAGAARVYFKYCSTFDSTDDGNIGPVADALCDALGARSTVVCPAFPANGRTVYLGHLFVGRRLVSESGMRDHPLTPMTDPDLVRVLGRQTAHAVGLVPYEVVDGGDDAVAAELARLAAGGVRHAVVDCLADRHLAAVAGAAAGMALVTGGSALAFHLAGAYRRLGLLPDVAEAPSRSRPGGGALVVAGSCSEATRAQVAAFAPGRSVLRVEPDEVMAGTDLVARALAVRPQLVASTAAPGEVAAAQARFGREALAAGTEAALAEVAAAMVGTGGVRRLVVAGGETAGAVMARLKVGWLRVGAEVAPGVPRCFTGDGDDPLEIVLKSGNFGGPGFFAEALA